ncbi:MAG: hypothetical protein ACR2QR_04965 [Woeseiaceae bacterium]
MKNLRSGLLALIALIPLSAVADVEVGDLPDDTVWYFHADLESMRNGEGSGPIYAWFEEEVAEDVREDVGIDITAEVDSVTAFGDIADGSIVIVNGPMTKATTDKILAMAAMEGPVDPREHEGETYYFFGDEDDIDDNGDELLEDLEDALFVSFAVNGKALITGTEAQMHDLLDRGGEVSGAGSHDGALLVLSANKSLVQAGFNTDGMFDEGDDDYGDDDDWESNIMRNTQEAAMLMADEDGQIAIEAQLVSSDPKMAEAIGGIVNGLIALQAFNSDLGPEFQALLRTTKVEVSESVLRISTVLDPELVVTILDD